MVGADRLCAARQSCPPVVRAAPHRDARVQFAPDRPSNVSAEPLGLGDTVSSMTRPIVAIDPVDTPFNSFVERFSRAIAAAGGDPVPMGWSLGELLRTDMVILHWPTLFMSLTSRKKAFAQLLRFRIARLMRGTRLVWVAHNVAPHEDGARHE